MQIHQCADFLMAKNEIEECSGKCLNGGVCVNGECACRTNFSGEFCENKSKQNTYANKNYCIRSCENNDNDLFADMLSVDYLDCRYLLLQSLDSG